MKVKAGYCHYIYLSDEWEKKPMESIKVLATVTLTHAPNKMIDKYDGKERDVWGDDWNDCPASCNSGTPYGGDAVDIEAGDLVIIIKKSSFHKENIEAEKK
jgi:hypothetical protein